jgi:enoyl-CoA hydratase/carnithine racemase
MPVEIETVDGIAVVTLSRPERLNAVDDALRDALIAALRGLNQNAGARAVVITGAGERAFCAGQDLEESVRRAPVDLPRWIKHQHAMYQAVRDLDKGCVAALNGVAAGAGFQIALCADLRVGHPELRIGQPEVKAGLASIVGTYLMTLQIGESMNRQLSLTGELIDGKRAYEVGLVNVLVPREAVLARAIEEAKRLAALPQTALRLSKERFRALTQPGFDEALVAGIRYQLECYASGEPQAAQRAFLEKKARR